MLMALEDHNRAIIVAAKRYRHENEFIGFELIMKGRDQ